MLKNLETKRKEKYRIEFSNSSTTCLHSKYLQGRSDSQGIVPDSTGKTFNLIRKSMTWKRIPEKNFRGGLTMTSLHNYIQTTYLHGRSGSQGYPVDFTINIFTVCI